MQEYLTDAVVLTREPNGDMDSRFSVFTKRYGKFTAKAKSARKITSKLSGHLEPGSISSLRIVEKNGLQIVDALKKNKIAANPRDLCLLSGLLADSEPDLGLWNLICGGVSAPRRDIGAAAGAAEFHWRRILKILGWDPAHAACAICGKSDPAVFDAEALEFFCASCSSKLPQDKLIYILDAELRGLNARLAEASAKRAD